MCVAVGMMHFQVCSCLVIANLLSNINHTKLICRKISYHTTYSAACFIIEDIWHYVYQNSMPCWQATYSLEPEFASWDELCKVVVSLPNSPPLRKSLTPVGRFITLNSIYIQETRQMLVSGITSQKTIIENCVEYSLSPFSKIKSSDSCTFVICFLKLKIFEFCFVVQGFLQSQSTCFLFLFFLVFIYLLIAYSIRVVNN